jgi:hypothetical protein
MQNRKGTPCTEYWFHKVTHEDEPRLFLRLDCFATGWILQLRDHFDRRNPPDENLRPPRSEQQIEDAKAAASRLAEICTRLGVSFERVPIDQIDREYVRERIQVTLLSIHLDERNSPNSLGHALREFTESFAPPPV